MLIDKLGGYSYCFLLFDGDGGDGNGEPSSSSGANHTQSSFENRLNKMNGDAMALAQRLYTENYQLREKNRELGAKVAPDGSIFVTQEDAKALEAYKALGKPGEVKVGLEDKAKFQGELAQSKKESLLRRVAEAAGFKFSVLVDRDRAAQIENKALEYEVRDVEVDGVKRQVAFIKDGGQETTITGYAKAQWSDYLPILQVSQGGGGQNSPTTSQASGTRFIGQSAGGGASGGNNLVDEYIKKQEEAGKAAHNPFLKPLP